MILDFDWEYPSLDGWQPVARMDLEDKAFGIQEKALKLVLKTSLNMYLMLAE